MTVHLSLYDFSDAIINEANPVDFGQAQKGAKGSVISVWLWNDRDNANSGDAATGIRLRATEGADDAIETVFDGTELNENQSCLEARSCGAKNIGGDHHEEWTKISPSSSLSVGNMPANSARLIELRSNVPIDEDTLSETLFNLMVTAD